MDCLGNHGIVGIDESGVVLVSNGKEAQRKYKGVVIDHVSVDEIMLLLVKGERV